MSDLTRTGGTLSRTLVQRVTEAWAVAPDEDGARREVGRIGVGLLALVGAILIVSQCTLLVEG